MLVLANKIYNNNSIRKLLLLKLPKYWLQFKNKFSVSFIIIFDTLPLRIIIQRVQTADLCWPSKSRRHLKRCTVNEFTIITVGLTVLHSVIFSFPGNWVPGSKSNNNNNNNNHDNAYGAIIMTKSIARVHPVHLMNVDWAPGGRQPSDQASRLGLWVCRKLAATIHIHHRHGYYYSARRLILILPSHGGWKAEST